MSEQLHPGPHPDADSLNAFLEGVLSEHERLECLAHLAECSYCREIVFLAQEPPATVAAPSRAPWWQRWLAPIPVLSGSLVASALAVGAWFYLHRAPVEPVHEAVLAPASAPPAVEHLAQQPSAKAKAQRPASVPKPFDKDASVKKELAVVPPPPPAMPASAPMAAPVPPPAPAPPPKVAESNALMLRSFAKSADSDRLNLRIEHNQGAGDLSEVAGSVTDPSGGVIPNANVTLLQIAGTSKGAAQTDVHGQFTISALPPGRYELQISAPGFQSASGQIELHAQDRAVVAPALSIGALTETVEVTAAATGIQTSTSAVASGSARRGKGVSDLPLSGRVFKGEDLERMKAPADTTAVRGKLMLKIDSAGALIFSKDAGKHWKTVKPLWTGHLVQLTTRAASPTSPEAFQLTTSSGSVWLSRDGVHWYLDSPPR